MKGLRDTKRKGRKRGLSRQYQYALRKRAKGLCWVCTKKALPGKYHCLEHLITMRERNRKRYGCKLRHFGRESYHLEDMQTQDVRRFNRARKSKHLI
jgi:hypothetical protein